VKPVQYAPRTGSVPIVPGNKDDVLRALAKNFPLVDHPRVEVQQRLGGHRGQTELALYYRVSKAASEEGIWEGELLAGELRDEFAARGFRHLASVYGTIVGPRGKTQDAGGGLGYVVSYQVFDHFPPNLAEVLGENAEKMGLENVRVATVVHGFQDALAITATTTKKL
jgi:hypothetical protein